MASGHVSATLAAVAGGLIFSLTLGAPSALTAQERNDVYAPINCDFGAIPCTDVGESRLLRTDGGVAVKIVTTELTNKDAYTVWWVVFNNPGACANSPDPCGEIDLGNPNVNATVQWATGDVVGKFGVGYFTAHLNEGETSPDGPVFGLPGDDVGLQDAFAAEIHVVVRSHGPAVDEVLNEQLTSFDGGCEVDVTPEIPKKKGECADVQFAIHQP